MKTVGIIAEYNPFHYGHMYQIEYAKSKLNADVVAVAMSGSFTQRGSIALTDKYTRAQMALKNGADLVFEIPTIFATASAKEFASAGCELLNKLGIVDSLLFGVESGDSAGFIKTARQIISLEKNEDIQAKIKNLILEGNSYALARMIAVSDSIDPSFISSPNNILGLEYAQYIQEHELSMSIETLKRQGAAYNDSNMSGKYSSATAIRNSLLKHKSTAFKAMPPESGKLLSKTPLTFSDDISMLLHQKLIEKNDFSDISDCTKEISNKIIKHLDEYTCFEDFTMLLKSKDLSLSRIKRVLCHILLSIDEETVNSAKQMNYIPYLRLLGFTEKGQEALKYIKKNAPVPIITKVTEANILLSEEAKKIFDYDIYSADIQRIIATNKSHQIIPTEYTHKFNT